MRGPCKECPNAGCGAYHSQCEKYTAWKAEQEKEKKWLRKMTFSITSKAAERAFRERLRYGRR